MDALIALFASLILILYLYLRSVVRKRREGGPRLETLLDQLPVAVALRASNHYFCFVNKTFRDQIGDPAGRPCYTFLHGRSEPCQDCPGPKVFDVETTRTKEWESPDGRTYLVHFCPLRNIDNRELLLEMGVDISRLKTLERTLSESEQRYRGLIESMNDGLVIYDEAFRITYANDRLCDMVGYDRREIIGKTVNDFALPEFAPVVEQQRAAALRGERSRYQLGLKRRDGAQVHAMISRVPLFSPEGRFDGGFAVVTDITELIRTQKTLLQSEEKLQRLSRDLISAQEDERGLLSRELHDDVGQSLSFLRFRMRSLQELARRSAPDVEGELQEAVRVVDQVLDKVRRISQGLSPPALEDLGLHAAVRTLIEDFCQSTGIDCDVHLVDDVDRAFDRKEQLALYRIIQEGLTNISRHAQARHARLSLSRAEGGMVLRLEDDGIGFDPDPSHPAGNSREGLGLATLEKRVHMLGGTLTVESRRGYGTLILVAIPMNRPARGNA